MDAKYKIHKETLATNINKRVWIIDLDEPGCKSVTNDANRIVAELHKTHPHYRIIYKDSMGNWDELLHVGPLFKGFGYVRQGDPVLMP